MTTRAEVVQAARALIDTPWHHHGRKPGKAGGVDCAGVAACIADAVGYPYKDDVLGYARLPVGNSLVDFMGQYLDCVPTNERKPGDFGVMWFDRASRAPQHIVVFVSPTRIVHAYGHVGKVVESEFDKLWQRRLTHVFRLRGIQED